MIITCPACETRFLLSAQALGSEGRDVRCAKCGHQWHALPQQAEAEELVLEVEEGFELDPVPEPEEGHPPPELDEALIAALSAPKPVARGDSPWAHPVWKVACLVLALGALLLTLLALREPLHGPLSPVYALLGFTAEEGLTLADVKLEPLPSRNKKRYEIQCNIVNQSKETRTVPKLRMQILNEAGLVVAEDADFLSETGKVLRPGKSLACKGLRFENPSKTADRLVIDLGSPLELKLRADWKEEPTDG